MVNIAELKFDAAGLIPAIVQDADTRVVLMQGYMNRESLAETERSGKVCFFSRSRQRLWHLVERERFRKQSHIWEKYSRRPLW